MNSSKQLHQGWNSASLCFAVIFALQLQFQPACAAVTLRVNGTSPDAPLGVVFRIGSLNTTTLTLEWDDNTTFPIQIVPEAETLSLPIDGVTQTIVLPAARLNFKTLKIPYYIRPRTRRYTTVQQIERLAAWQSLPGADEVDVLFEAIPDAEGCQFFIDRRYAGRKDHDAHLQALVITLPDGGTAQAVEALNPNVNPHFLTIDFAAAAQPGVLTNAQVSLAPGLQTLNNIPMIVAAAKRAGDISRVRQMKGSWALECDEYLSRTTFDGMPESQMLTVPPAFYHRGWVLFTVDPDPAKDTRMTLRLTRFAGNSVVGRGSAIAEADLDLPRCGDPLPDNITQVGEVRLPSANGDTVLPLLLAQITFPLGDMLELLADDKPDPAADLKFGSYLDFEILGRRGKLGVQWDGRHKPSGDNSAAHVFGVTLEQAPAELRLYQSQPGNIFHNNETPQLTASIHAVRDGCYTLSWTIRDIDGSICIQDSRAFTMAAGATKDYLLSLAQNEVGYYDLGFEFRTDAGDLILTHEAAFALLGMDTREAEYNSPYGVWWFGGHHLTVRDIAMAGPLHFKAGLRRTVSTRYSEAEMAPWKITRSSFGWRFKMSDLDNFEVACDRVSAELDVQRLRYPSCNNVLTFHESHANTMPLELAGLQPEYNEQTLESCRQKAQLANKVGQFYRDKYPDLKIIIGNSGGSIRIMADLLRFGFNPDFCDYIGIETPGQTFLPESISEHNIMAAWASREIGRLHGHEIALTASYEFTYRTDRMLGPRCQAEYYVRDILLAHALGFDHISPAVLDDAGSSYGNTLWGSAGLLRRNPLLYPKPAYVAVATATRVLDRCALPHIITNGSLTVHTLEMQRQRTLPDYVYANWTVRGEAELSFDFGSAAEVVVVDIYGRSSRLQTENGSIILQTGTAAKYLISPIAVQKVSLVNQTFSQDQPPVDYIPANRMDCLDDWNLSSDRYLSWINEAGGSFQDPNNWSPSRVPGTNDIALFSLTNTPYTVSWSENVTNFEFSVKSGTVTWDLKGNSYALNVDCINTIGNDNTPTHLTMTNGIVQRITRAARYSNPLRLFGNGTTLNLRNAQFLNNNYPLIEAGTQVIIDGADAKFDSYGYSRAVEGLVIVTNGGFLNAPSGFSVTGGGDLRVHGPGYRASFASSTAGIDAEGSILFGNGAEVRSAGSQKISFYGPLTLDKARYYYYYVDPDYGWIHLKGPHAVIQGSGEVEMGRIILEGGWLRPGGKHQAGVLSFTGLITNAQPASGGIEIELGGAQAQAHDSIRLIASQRGPGTLYAQGTLEIAMIKNYQPAVQTTFKIFDAVDIVGTFDKLNLPNLPGQWLTDRLYSEGLITYLPPDGLLLMLK